MAAQYKDYQGLSVGQAGCTYASLRNTYGFASPASSLASSCNNNPAANMAYSLGAVQAPKMSNYIVPKMCPNGPGPNYPPRYDTLSHQQPYLCGGYFNITSAYPDANCTDCALTFTNRPCSGNIMNQCNGGK